METKHEQIEKDVVALQESMAILSNIVQEQQEPIDTLENFILESKISTQQGTELLESPTSSAFMYALGGIATLMLYLIL